MTNDWFEQGVEDFRSGEQQTARLEFEREKVAEILQTARRKELKREQKIASLQPGTPIGKSELEDLNAAIDNAPIYGDTELDRLQETPEYDDWRQEQDKRAESLMDEAKGN